MVGRRQGRRISGRARRWGEDLLHVAVDGATRVAFVQVHADDRTAAAFVADAVAFLAGLGAPVERVRTDDGACYRSRRFRAALAGLGAAHKRTQPYRPQANGKVERFHPTLAAEWAYAELYATNGRRLAASPARADSYNRRRPRTALGGSTPMASLVNNVAGNYSQSTPARRWCSRATWRARPSTTPDATRGRAPHPSPARAASRPRPPVGPTRPPQPAAAATPSTWPERPGPTGVRPFATTARDNRSANVRPGAGEVRGHPPPQQPAPGLDGHGTAAALAVPAGPPPSRRPASTAYRAWGAWGRLACGPQPSSASPRVQRAAARSSAARASSPRRRTSSAAGSSSANGWACPAHRL